MGKEKYNKEELIRLLIHEGKSYKEVAAMRGDGSNGEAIRKAANRYGIKVSDRKKLRKCEYCGKEHDGSFGSGRFCCSDCAKKYSLSFSKGKKRGNSSISSLDAKRMNLKRYNSHKTRSLEVTPTAPGQNEWVKRVKTNGQARWENNGLYIPGFEKL